jgi:hypothetical protein
MGFSESSDVILKHISDAADVTDRSFSIENACDRRLVCIFVLSVLKLLASLTKDVSLSAMLLQRSDNATRRL